jgi:diadenosine tetraphosphate (Ap4A) HIT family hydrolase
MSACLICDRIGQIKAGENPFFVTELATGYVVLGDHQFYHGYTLFLSKIHVRELHELDQKMKILFLSEMSVVAEAVYTTFKPDKLNYELLGNTDEHLHWHIFPRRMIDPMPHTGVWAVSKEIRNASNTIPTNKQLTEMKIILLKTITTLI